MRKAMALGLVALFALSLFIMGSSWGEVVLVSQNDFDDGTVGTVIANETYNKMAGDEQCHGQEGGMTLALLAKFSKLNNKVLIDADWYGGVAVLLYKDGIYTFKDGQISPAPIYTFSYTPSFGSVITYWHGGEVFVVTTTTTHLEGGGVESVLRCYAATSPTSNFVLTDTLTYQAPIPLHVYAKYSTNDYVLFGGTGFLAKYTNSGVVVLDDSFVWPMNKPEHLAFDKYYFDVWFTTAHGDRWYGGLFTEEWTYSNGEYLDVPFTGDLLQYAFGGGSERSRQTMTMWTTMDWVAYLYPGVGIYVALTDALGDPEVHTVSFDFHPYQLGDIGSYHGNIYLVGNAGLIAQYYDGNATAVVQSYTGWAENDYKYRIYNSLANGWISSCYGYNGLRSLNGAQVPISGTGCWGIVHHPKYGYIWMANKEMYVTADPRSGVYRTYDLTDPSLYPPTNPETLPTGVGYRLYSDPTSGYILVRTSGVTGLVELKNYTKDGNFVAEKCKLDRTVELEDGKGTAQAVLTAVEMTWQDDVPPGTSYQVYVSNDGGDTWENITNGEKHTFATADVTRDTFTYKIEMHSDSPWQQYTPTIWNLKYKLYVNYIPVVNIDLTPHLRPDENGNVTSWYYTYEPVNFTAWDTFDIDISDYNLYFKWDFGDPYARDIPWPSPHNPTSTMHNPNTDEGYWVWNTTHIYTEPGTYTVTLNVTDEALYSASNTVTVTIHNRPPHAVLAEDNYALLEGDFITLDGTNSWDFDGDITAYKWEIRPWNEGTYNTPTMTHTFTTSGNRTVELWVTDNDGDQDVAKATIHVTAKDTYPEARFTVSSTRVQFGTPITFTSTSTDRVGYIANYTWDMGDGTKYYTPTVTHTYTEPGRYDVTLYVTDNASQTSSTTKRIEVTVMPPSGDWIVDTHVLCKGWQIGMQGNIIIKGGGWLEVEDSNIIFMNVYNGQYGIKIEAGGKLTTANSAIGPWYHPEGESHKGVYNYFSFENYGEAYINSSVVKGVDSDKSAFRQGITQFEDGLLSAKHSYIVDSEGYAVSTSSALYIGNVRITLDDDLIANALGGIYVKGGTSTLKDTRIKNTKDAMMVLGGETTITQSMIRTGREYGIYFNGGNLGVLSVDNSTIAFCGRAVDVYSTTLKFADNIVMGAGNKTNGFVGNAQCTLYRSTFSNSYRGVFAYAADVTVIDCTVRDNTVHYSAGSGGRVLVDNYLTVIVKYRGKAVSGAIVKIFNSDSLEHNDTTVKGAVGPYQLHYAIVTADGITSPNWTVRVEYAGLSDYRIVDMKTTHTEVFSFNPPKPQKEGGGGILTFGGAGWPSWWVIVGIIATWVTVAIGMWRRWWAGRMPLVMGVAGVITTVLMAAWYWMFGIASVWIVIGLGWYMGWWKDKLYYVLAGGGILSGGIYAYVTGIAASIPPYTIPIAVLWAAIGASWYFLPIVRRNLIRVLIGGAVASLMIYLYFTNVIVLYIMLVIGLLLGVLWLALGKGIRMPLLTSRKRAQLGIGNALIVIFVLTLILLIVADLLGVWWPGKLIGEALGGVGESVSKATGGWYPGKTVDDIKKSLGW